MFGFLKKQSNDDILCKEFLQQVLIKGRETCAFIGQVINKRARGKTIFAVSDEESLEVSLAIAGSILALLQGGPPLMTMDRGKQISRACRRSFEKDFGLTREVSNHVNLSLDGYQAAFQQAVADSKNPFGEVAGIMLVNSMGKDVTALCLPGTTVLNPFIHQVVGDLLTIATTEASAFWKGR